MLKLLRAQEDGSNVIPPFILSDLVDRTVYVPLFLHLSAVPLSPPYQLTTLPEASWPGYEPAELFLAERKPEAEETCGIRGYGVFRNDNLRLPVNAKGAWLTGIYPPANGTPALLAVVTPLDAELPPGETTLEFIFDTYQLEWGS